MNHKVALSFADGKTLFLPVGHDDLLLDAALRHGINLPLDCREGVCGTCMGRCEAGSYSLDYADEDTLSAADLEQRKVLACQTRVRSDAAFYFDFASTLCHAASWTSCPASTRACKYPAATAGAPTPSPTGRIRRTTCNSSSACSRAAP